MDTLKKETETNEQAIITREARENGFVLDWPLYTKDGGRVRVLGIDRTARFDWPIIAYIIEEEFFVHRKGTKISNTRLAKFDTNGNIWAKTESDRCKHSLRRNVIKFRRWPSIDQVVFEPVHDEPVTKEEALDHRVRRLENFMRTMTMFLAESRDYSIK